MSDIDTLQRLISSKFTKEVLTDILCKKSNSKDITIKEIKLGEASKKGDSYLSTVTRFYVKYSFINKLGDSNDNKIYIIVKALPKNVARTKTFRSAEFFSNEFAFYEQVWPKLNQFQKSKNIKTEFQDIPLYLAGYTDGTNDFIALEDLSFQGYGTAQRSEGLNKEHTVMIINKFARFHALGLAYKDQHPEEFEETANHLQETYFSENTRTWYSDFQETLKSIVRDAVKKELPDMYLQKINELFAKDFFGILSKICGTRGPLAVITHGDAWVPNFLMKYDSNSKNPISAIMIDFQLARCASIALDLHFFLYSCTDQKLREQHYNEILEIYQKTFTTFLKELGSSEDLLTLDKLKADLKEFGPFAVGMSMEAIVMSLLEDDEVSDIDSIKGENAVPLVSVWIVKPFKTAEKRQRCAEFVKHCVDFEYI